MAVLSVDIAAKSSKALDWRRRPRKVHVEPEWLRREYHEKQRRVGDIAAEIGCCVETLNALVKKYGIPRRDGRAGRLLPTRRSVFDLQRAAWMYEVQRLSCEAIGEQLGCHGSTVRRRLCEAGYAIRHHNDTKRGAPSPNRIKIDGGKIASAYRRPKVGIASVARLFGVSSKVVARILDDQGVVRKPFDDCRNTPNGEAHPSWKAELTAQERAVRRDGNRQNEWQMKVYERDGFKYTACGDATGGNLNAHHIEAHCENKRARWEVSNGATLCASCHRSFHRRYGMRGFGRNELIEFVEARAGEAKGRLGL